jgi:hypothetical protein
MEESMTQHAGVPVWSDGITLYEEADLLKGGAGGALNLAVEQLADRTEYLRQSSVSYPIRPGEVGVVNVNRPDGDPFRQGAVANGVADDTKAIANMFESGYAAITFPAGGIGGVYNVFRHGPITVVRPVIVHYEPNAWVEPAFNAGGNDKLYTLRASNITIDGLQLKNVVGITQANKYVVYVARGANHAVIRNCRLNNILLSDGHSGNGEIGFKNLIVTHAIYAEGATDLLIEGNQIANVSGAAVFCRDMERLEIRRNHITNTRWYSVNLDSGCRDFRIESNVIDGDDPLARYWGGSINLMSAVGGARNRFGTIANNTIAGTHNYGAAIRLLSVQDTTVESNTIRDVVGGSLGRGPVQYIGLDRRGTAVGKPENGPCSDVEIRRNKLIAGRGPQIGIYAKNEWTEARDPHVRIKIEQNTIISPDQTHYFAAAVSVHGFAGGFKELTVAGNTATVLTGDTMPVGGAFGFESATESGSLESVVFEANQASDFRSSAPRSSVECGAYFAPFIDGLRLGTNVFENFYIGLRTRAGIRDVSGLEQQRFRRCVHDTLLQTA